MQTSIKPIYADSVVTNPKSPQDCQTKDDVRAEIDRVDQALLNLFAERHRYVTRMAEIKTDPHEARDPARIESVIAKVVIAVWLLISMKIRPNLCGGP